MLPVRVKSTLVSEKDFRKALRDLSDTKGEKISIPMLDYNSLFYDNYPRIIPKSTFRSLGSAAIKSITPTYSYTYDTPLNYVLSEDIHFNYPLTPVGPLIDSVYDTVDDDIEYRNKVTKYFYEKLFNKWIFTHLKKILKFFKIKSNKIVLVKTKNEYNSNKSSDEEKRDIVEFIINNIYDKYDLKHSLKKFIKMTDTKWLELQRNKENVLKIIYRDIKTKIKKFNEKN